MNEGLNQSASSGPESEGTKVESKDTPKAKEPHEQLEAVLSEFIREIDSLASTFPLTSDTIRAANFKAGKELTRFLREHAKPIKTSESGNAKGERVISFEIDLEQGAKFEVVKRSLSRTALAGILVPRSLFVALISQFDSYLGMLIKTLLLFKPEILNASEKTMRFSDLVEFESIEAARDHIIEKEIGAILRESHTEHFEWMEAKFDIKLRKELPVWAEFVEITERRNLFVHTGGAISDQYLKVCGGAGLVSLSLSKGKRLSVKPAYFERAYEVIFEIGVKLAHVLWRKLIPAKLKEADQNLLMISFDLIVEGKYALAIVLLDFATVILKRHSSADYRLRFVINRAQAYKWSGDEMRALEILDAEDFSAVKAVFRLAETVLRDDFSKALTIVREIGSNGEIGINEYREWPLFRELRKSEEFAHAILEIFNLPLHEVSLDRATQELASATDGLPNGSLDAEPAKDSDASDPSREASNGFVLHGD